MTEADVDAFMHPEAGATLYSTSATFADNHPQSNGKNNSDSLGEGNNNKNIISTPSANSPEGRNPNGNDAVETEHCPNENPHVPQQGDLSQSASERQGRNEGRPESNNNSRGSHFEYQKDYPINRTSRKWKRQEVQGLCCLSIEVLCLVALAMLSLYGMGYFGELGNDGHVPHTFSWKILREFFTYEEVGSNSKECTHPREINRKGNAGASSGRNYFRGMTDEDFDYDAEMNDNDRALFDLLSPQERGMRFGNENPVKDDCDFSKSRQSIDWLLKMLSANFMAVINTFTSGLFFASLAARRRKGLQVILLIPSFLCFFMSIFQQIPTTFHYNYVNLLIRDEMRAAITQSSSPNFVIPVLEETQIHMQCCGIEEPSTWERVRESRYDGPYPGSCCNTTAHDCGSKTSIPKSKVWSVGCYQVVYDRVHTFERWTLFILGFKIIAEVGIFCALSDLTRYDYPPPEQVENSRCDFRDYQIKCKGIARIKGVTKDGRIVVSSGLWITWRLIPSRVDLANGVLMHLKNDLNQIKGSVEILKRSNLATFLNEDIQVDLTRKNRGVFVFTLT